MENPRTGIVILALVAVTALAGGLFGWSLRQPGTGSEAGVALPAGSDGDKLPPDAVDNHRQVGSFVGPSSSAVGKPMAGSG